MCGRFTYLYSWRQLRALLNLSNPGATIEGEFADDDPLFGRRYNVAPTQTAPIVRMAGTALRVVSAKWGLMPQWATRPGPINARAETVATNGMFRSAFQKRRCVVPASGFYEWQALPGAKVKQPWYIARADGRPLLLAGLYETRDEGETFTIITTDANELMRPVHDRMPAVLEPEAVGPWLDGRGAGLLAPAADGVLTAHKVGTKVNSPKNDDPSLIEPAP